MPALLAVIAGFLAQTAQAYIYFGNVHAIGRAELDGSNVERSFIPISGFACGVAVDSGHIYWGDEIKETIGRANISGGEVEPDFITGAGPVCGVAVNATSIYWTNRVGSIGHATINGSDVNPVADPLGEVEACGVAVDSENLYYGWSNGSAYGISRASLTSTPELLETMTTEASGKCGIAVDSSWLYWANGGLGSTADSLGRIAKVPPHTPFNNSFIKTEASPWGVAVDASHLYWTNYQTATIGRSDLAAESPPEQQFITGLQEPVGIAVDNLAPPIPAPHESPSPPHEEPIQSSPPPVVLEIGKPMPEKNGTAILAVTVSGSGTVSVKGKGIVQTTVKVKGKGKVKLSIKPTMKIKKELAKTGKATVTAKVTFTPTGGTPHTQSKTLTLRG